MRLVFTLHSDHLDGVIMASNALIQIQLLGVKDCPLIPKLRQILHTCLAKADVETEFEELIGDYASPTLLINGVDVTGRPQTELEQVSCRLDIPSEEQIMSAIRQSHPPTS